jgi:hypothetical protein
MIEAKMAKAKRFWIAMCVFGLLGVLEWTTLDSETIRVVNGPNGAPLLDISIRGVALAVLALFAFRSWIHYRREILEERSRSGQE